MRRNEVVLIEGARTPFGKYGGTLKEIPAIDLGAHATKEAIARSGVEINGFDQVVIGNVQH